MLDVGIQLNEKEKIIKKYHIEKYHKRGTKIFENMVEHFKYIEKHNKKCEERCLKK